MSVCKLQPISSVCSDGLMILAGLLQSESMPNTVQRCHAVISGSRMRASPRTRVGPSVAGAQQHPGPRRHAPHVQALAQAAPAGAPAQLIQHPVTHGLCTAVALAIHRPQHEHSHQLVLATCHYCCRHTEHAGGTACSAHSTLVSAHRDHSEKISHGTLTNASSSVFMMNRTSYWETAC